MRTILLLALLVAGLAFAQQPPKNASVDPEHIFVGAPVPNPLTEVVEPVRDSDFPLHLLYVETVDGLYAPVGLRKPAGNGPFPVVLFAHMNGGLGARWIREWTDNGSWTLEQFLKAGYAVAWLRYRAEVRDSYGEPLKEGTWEGRQIFNRGPLEYDDAIATIKFVKTLPYVDAQRVGYLGLSHGGEMLMKIASEYDGLRCGVASEPASIDYLARKPMRRPPGAPPIPETLPPQTEEMQLAATEEMRGRLDLPVAQRRIAAIKTPMFVQGRDRDHNQPIFRLNYALMKEAGKPVEWKSYDHDEHGFIFVRRNQQGAYAPDAIQRQAVADVIGYFDRCLKK
jgi:dienelactone hydrolase